MESGMVPEALGDTTAWAFPRHRSDLALNPPSSNGPGRWPWILSVKVIGLLASAALVLGCEGNPDTQVVLENDYAPDSGLVIYQAAWQAVPFQDAIAPGFPSEALTTVPASPNTAYVVLAPGWNPDGGTAPTSLVALQSRQGYGVHLSNTLTIRVNDEAFMGNCAAGSFLTASQAHFITQIVFPGVFEAFTYDPMTCTTTPIGDAGTQQPLRTGTSP